MKTLPLTVPPLARKEPSGILVAFIAALLLFSVLPNVLGADLFWTGDASGATPAVAGSGTWVNDNPGEFTLQRWSTSTTSPANAFWTNPTETNPDVAHFLGSTGGTVTLGSDIVAAGINFDPGASAFIIHTVGTAEARNVLQIQGAGIVNGSGRTQIIDNDGGTDVIRAGATAFSGAATADNTTITNDANGFGNVSGSTAFSGAATAGSATIINNGGTGSRAFGGITTFSGSATAGSATIINNGGTGSGTTGGRTTFSGASDGGTARVITNGNGTFDISGLQGAGMGIGSIEGSGEYFLGSKALRVGGNGLSATVSGVITDVSDGFSMGGSLTKVGPGTLTLTGTNTYAGGTAINAGALQIGNGGTTGTIVGDVTDNASLTFDRSDGFAFGGAIRGTGNLNKRGAGTLTLTGANTYGGGTSLTGGVLAVNGDANLGTGALRFNGGTLEALGTGGGLASGKAVRLAAGGGTFLADAGTASTLSGAMTGVGGWTKSGPGILTLSGTNTYTGVTTVSGGVLRAGSTAAFSAGSAFKVNAGAVLDLNGFNNAVGSLSGSGRVSNAQGPGPATLSVGTDNTNATFGGTLQDGVSSLALTKVGTGTLTLSGVSAYTGGTTVSAGTLQLGDGGTTGTIAGDVTDNGTLVFNRADALTFPGVIRGTGALVKEGAGALTLAGSNTYAGGTAVNNGLLIPKQPQALGTGPVAVTGTGSTLQVNTGLALANPVSLVRGGTLDNAGAIAGAVSLSNGGSLVNRATGTLGRGVLANAGPVTLTNAGRIDGNVFLNGDANTAQLVTGSSLQGNLTFNPAALTNQLTLEGEGNNTLGESVSGAVLNVTTLTKQGSGTWTVDKLLRVSGVTEVRAGAFVVDARLMTASLIVGPGATLAGGGTLAGSAFNHGFLQPGPTLGTLTIQGDYTQYPDGSLDAGIASASRYSQLNVTGQANLAGTLRLRFLNGYRPSPQDRFQLVRAASINGQFQTVVTSGGVPVRLRYNPAEVELTVPSVQTMLESGFRFSDGTPVSTTALLANASFDDFGSRLGRWPDGFGPGTGRLVNLTFDAGEFHYLGRHGTQYSLPITGGFKLTERASLTYEVPLQYVSWAGAHIYQGGLTLNLPVKAVLNSERNPWSWEVIPTLAFAASGSRQLIFGAALTNVISRRWGGVKLSYANHFSAFGSTTLSQSDPLLASSVSQQIMKHGLRVSVPFAQKWIVEPYGIYTQFLQPAAVDSYFTVGIDLGYNLNLKVKGQPVAPGYVTLGLYTELGNQYDAGHCRVGSSWRF